MTVTATAGGAGIFDIIDGKDWVICSRGHVEESVLFTLFTAYFSTSELEQPGLLVTTETDGQVRLIAIAPGEDASRSGPLTVVVDPAELLVNMAVFQAAWPGLTLGDAGDVDDLAKAGEVIEQAGADGLTIGALVQDPGLDRDSISFFVFGMTPRDVMTQLLRPETFILEDEGFAVIELEAIDNRIEVVSFQTDRGLSRNCGCPWPWIRSRRPCSGLPLWSRRMWRLVMSLMRMMRSRSSRFKCWTDPVMRPGSSM